MSSPVGLPLTEHTPLWLPTPSLRPPQAPATPELHTPAVWPSPAPAPAQGAQSLTGHSWWELSPRCTRGRLLPPNHDLRRELRTCTFVMIRTDATGGFLSGDGWNVLDLLSPRGSPRVLRVIQGLIHAVATCALANPGQAAPGN